MPLSESQLEEEIKGKLAGVPVSFNVGKSGLEAHVGREHLIELCKLLHDEPSLCFDYLRCISTVDWIEDGQIEVVYHLYSMAHGHCIIIKVRIPREEPKLPTVSGIWAAANWLEREAYDLMGVVFDGHPDLRRILLPQDWEGHPLRKDYSYDPVEFDEWYAAKVRRGEIP
ncbi:MAG: NADH-quinone oxidoreductase subunit C [Armatimonadota bacterium]|nr:NADH-quinone oxidoreductase subunit C [Armatimonadota bacterium]MCX7776990.1 NADH-quinone oxidoreductase subunit C [Armatimonadota bacterium]MDW8024824.1 NADH-quinone oxidoreductase subunit C [Armatimonadota bacterium]